MSDFNKQVIQEFRANQGVVGGHFAGMDLLLLHTKGAKSGELRINPVVYFEEEDNYIIAASKGGSDNHPDWYHNLVTNPDVIFEVGEDTLAGTAVVADEPERSELYAKLASRYPMFNEYKSNTQRVIPIIKLSKN